MKMPDLFCSENSKRIIILLVIVALGTLMAARKQFVTNYTESLETSEYSAIEGDEKELGHIHPLLQKDAFAPPALSLIPYALRFSKGAHVISPVIHWIFAITLVALIVRRAGFDYYSSIVLTMFVLFVGNLFVREIFDIPLLGPAPYIGYQNLDFRVIAALLPLVSILLILHGQIILSGALVGLMAVIHIKYGLRVFGLLVGCMILWNLWGYRLVKAPNLKISWRSVAGFCCCWIVPFMATYLYILDSISMFTELKVPRVTTPFLSQLGWLMKNEPDDWMISHALNSDVQFFGFLFLAIISIIFCELIRRRTQDTKLKIMAVVLTLSVFIALLFFGYGFLFEIFLIDLLPLSWSTTLMLTRVWDLLWVVVIAFTISIFLYGMLWAENLGRKYWALSFINPLAIQKLFLHFAFAGFVLLQLYIFFDKKEGSIIRKMSSNELPSLTLDHTQICTKDTALYEKTLSSLWKLTEKKNETEFYKNLQVLEDIFDRTLKPVKNEKINNPDVKNMRILHNLKSNRYRIASQELLKPDHVGRTFYFWGCDKKGPGLHRELVRVPFRDFYDVSQWVKQNTPIDRGVIAPPYFSRFDIYSRRVSFWDGKRDGHLMYETKDWLPIGLHRLQALAGTHALLEDPGFRHGKPGLRGRAYFLSLQQEDLRKIRKNYPHYDYLVTENQALSGLPKLYANVSFAVYDISEKQD